MKSAKSASIFGLEASGPQFHPFLPSLPPLIPSICERAIAVSDVRTSPMVLIVEPNLAPRFSVQLLSHFVS